MTAPTTAMMNPAASPSGTDPARDRASHEHCAYDASTIVRMIPPGSLPGMISLATETDHEAEHDPQQNVHQ